MERLSRDGIVGTKVDRDSHTTSRYDLVWLARRGNEDPVKILVLEVKERGTLNYEDFRPQVQVSRSDYMRTAAPVGEISEAGDYLLKQAQKYGRGGALIVVLFDWTNLVVIDYNPGGCTHGKDGKGLVQPAMRYDADTTFNPTPATFQMFLFAGTNSGYADRTPLSPTALINRLCSPPSCMDSVNSVLYKGDHSKSSLLV